MGRSVTKESIETEIKFPTNLSYELKARDLPRQLRPRLSSGSVNDNHSSMLDQNEYGNSGAPSTSPSAATELPSPPSEMPDDWITCFITQDSYSRATTNIKFLLPRHAATTAIRSASTVQYLLPAHPHPENRFVTASLGYICDMWPQLIDAFIPGSPYSAAGMVRAMMALGKGQCDTEKGIVLDEGSARDWVKYWYATTSMTVQVYRALPGEGVDWLWTRVCAESIRDGRMDIRIIVADAEGTVATGVLSVLVVDRRAQGATAKESCGGVKSKDSKRESKI